MALTIFEALYVNVEAVRELYLRGVSDGGGGIPCKPTAASSRQECLSKSPSEKFMRFCKVFGASAEWTPGEGTPARSG
jgi:hypothetical protein